MQDILAGLMELKRAIAEGKVTDKHVDMVNSLIKQVNHVQSGPASVKVLPQEELLPADGVNMTAETIIINVNYGYPPTLLGEDS